MATSTEQTKQEQQLPPPDNDFYGIVGTLSQEDRSCLSRVRAFMEEKVAPIINDYWMRDEFPFDVLPAMSDLGIAGTPYEGYGCLGKGTLMDGLVTTEPSCPRASRRKRGPDRLTWAASWPTPRRCTRTRARARSTRLSWGAP